MLKIDVLPNEVESAWVDRLSTDEKNRYWRFKSKKKQKSYLFGRTLARHMLNQHFELNCDDWEISPQGRNLVFNAPEEIYINISHSKEYVTCGISESSIGIDIEQIRTDRSLMKIAKKYFCPSEYEDLQSIPLDQQIKAFYLLWVIKEAGAKRGGKSVFYGLSEIQISIKERNNRFPIISLPNNYVCGYYLHYEDYVIAVSLNNKVQLQSQLALFNGKDIVPGPSFVMKEI